MHIGRIVNTQLYAITRTESDNNGETPVLQILIEKRKPLTRPALVENSFAIFSIMEDLQWGI